MLKYSKGKSTKKIEANTNLVDFVANKIGSHLRLKVPCGGSYPSSSMN